MSSKSSRARGWGGLVLTSASLVLIWTVVLPRWSATPRFQQHWGRLQEKGVDPSAMYYSDLEAMPRIERQIRDTVQSHREAFYRPGG